MISAPDSEERVRAALKPSETGAAGLEQVDGLLSLVSGQVPDGRVTFTPGMVRGLSYYTGPIWELVTPAVTGSIGGGGRYDHLIADLGGPDVPATGAALGIERILAALPGSEGGRSRLDVAVTVMGETLAARAFAFAGLARAAGLRAAVYLGSSGKLGRQLEVGQRLRGPLVPALRCGRGRGGHGHGPGHEHRGAGRGPGGRAGRAPGRAGRGPGRRRLMAAVR